MTNFRIALACVLAAVAGLAHAHHSNTPFDMSQSFIKGIGESFPQAHLTFDRFHVIKLMNDAVDEVRRQEQKAKPELKKTRFSWLKNEENMKLDEKERFQALKNSTLDTARAYRLKLGLQNLYDERARFAP